MFDTLIENFVESRRISEVFGFIMLPCKCTVSARKYEQNSWLRVQIANFVAYHLWARGWRRRKG